MEVFVLSSFSPSKDIIKEAYYKNNLRKVEDEHNIRIVVSDNKFIYVTDIDVYNYRMKQFDVMLGNPLALNILLKETWLHECKTRDGTFYTLGNIYGDNSILFGPKFSDIVDLPEFKDMIGCKLKSVSLKLMKDSNNELKYVVNSYELRNLSLRII